jgi:hypothetical protein
MSEENTVVEEVVETAAPEVAAPEVAAKVEAVATEPKENPLAGFLALKETNKNAFYGIIGGVGAIVVTLLALGMGGDDEILKKANTQSIASGQKYTLKSPNAAPEGGEVLTVRLVSTPGAIAAFDDDENKEECRKFPVGTNVTVLDKQQMANVVYAKVQIDEANCNGTIGWVLGINL